MKKLDYSFLECARTMPPLRQTERGGGMDRDPAGRYPENI